MACGNFVNRQSVGENGANEDTPIRRNDDDDDKGHIYLGAINWTDTLVHARVHTYSIGCLSIDFAWLHDDNQHENYLWMSPFVRTMTR